MFAILYNIIAGLIGLGVGTLIGYVARKKSAEATIQSAELEAKRILDEGKKEADSTKKEYLVEAKEEIHKMRTDVEKENRERRNELQRLERRLVHKEEMNDKKSESLEQKDDKLNIQLKKIEQKNLEIETVLEKQVTELERLSSLTSEEARELLLSNVRKEVTHDTALMIKELESKAKFESDKKARDIIALAIQKCAADYVAESTVSVVSLPNDEMKGRIIGREGRNIRALETLTGVDLIIDDTPEAVILSAFDPIRREVARIALEKLISDGRIHPARIEEMVLKARKEIEDHILETGHQAAFDSGIHGLHPELTKLLGRLQYRTSYGQNVLKHSIEVSILASIMAVEIGADVKIAKRAGLLHDIGKSVDHEIEGPHVAIGVDLCRKYKESPEVINCIAAHHGDVEADSIEAVLVQAADAISAARPGARRETLESYIKRLETLENIANSFDGVDKAFAIQAGREVRIMVKSEDVTDDEITLMSRDIVKRIESELEYPGQIKVNVIRETRAVEYAK